MKRPAKRPTEAKLVEHEVMASTPDEIALVEHARMIRLLGHRVLADVIEIGVRLLDAKARCGHGNWLPWLEREFAWSESTALRYMRAAQ